MRASTALFVLTLVFALTAASEITRILQTTTPRDYTTYPLEYQYYLKFMEGLRLEQKVPMLKTCRVSLEQSQIDYSAIDTYLNSGNTIDYSKAYFDIAKEITDLHPSIINCYDFGDEFYGVLLGTFAGYPSASIFFTQFLQNAIGKIFDWIKIGENMTAAANSGDTMEVVLQAGNLVRKIFGFTPSEELINQTMTEHLSKETAKYIEAHKMTRSLEAISLEQTVEPHWYVTLVAAIGDFMQKSNVFATEKSMKCHKYFIDFYDYGMTIQNTLNKVTTTEYSMRTKIRDLVHLFAQPINQFHDISFDCYNGSLEIGVKLEGETEVFKTPTLIGFNVLYNFSDFYNSFLYIAGCAIQAQPDGACIASNIGNVVMKILFGERLAPVDRVIKDMTN